MLQDGYSTRTITQKLVCICYPIIICSVKTRAPVAEKITKALVEAAAVIVLIFWYYCRSGENGLTNAYLAFTGGFPGTGIFVVISITPFLPLFP